MRRDESENFNQKDLWFRNCEHFIVLQILLEKGMSAIIDLGHDLGGDLNLMSSLQHFAK